ncbi:MAG: flagellar biosynthetic protein FliR [Candidimonas sp.]|nr:MAG: flagellar biosynthetic protein FliR [Candidimonas sp.]
MIDINTAQWSAWIGAFIYPLARIAAFVAAAPVFGESYVAIRVKIGLSVVFAIAMQAQASGGAGTAVPIDSAQGFMLIVTQIVVGLALAFSVKLVFAAVQTAGDFIGLEMSLSFASFFDPSTGSNTNAVSRLFNIVALLLFISINGHLLLIAGLAQTFTLIPLDQILIDRDGIGQLLNASRLIFSSGALLALPIMVTLLILNLILGILNRTAQQLSIFSVGFPVTLIVGILVLGLMLPTMQTALEHLTMHGVTVMSEVAEHLAR